MAISTTQVPALGANYEIITASGTWTPPVGYSVFDVIILGAGGGGGGGSYAENVSFTYAFGGAGGASGFGRYFQGMRITAPVSVTIGVGGAGGAGAIATGGNGSNGSRGSVTVFNGIVSPGGGGGRGGFATTSTTARSSAGSSNPYGCYDETIGTTAMYVLPARHSTSYSITAEGGSGGSNGGNTSNSATNSTVPWGTSGGSHTFEYSKGGIYAGCTSVYANQNNGYGSTDTKMGLIQVPGGLSQVFGPRQSYDSGISIHTTNQESVRSVGDMWWVPGGGGAGYGVGGGATAGWGEGGYAGTATSGGLHGYSTSLTNTLMNGQSATAYGAGGGGGGGTFNTGTPAGAGGAGANGVVIVYWGM